MTVMLAQVATLVTDIDDPGHLVVIERWESIEHDNAYRPAHER